MGNSNIEKVLLQIKTDLEDLKNLRAELKTVKQEANETGKSVGDSFKSAFGSLAAGFTVLKIKSFMDNAVGEFNKLEKTMLGLQATARLTGNSFEALKKQVTALSTDGVLSIDQASTAMKTLLAQGIQADKAFSLLDAAKKVGAFNNIVGDTGQAVADFVKFLQTGSAELAENLDPSIIKVVKSLGGYEKIASDAGAKQKLINAVIEKGGKLTQDYEKFLNSGAQAQVSFNSAGVALSQTLGQKLQPAYNALFAAGTKLLNGISSLLERTSAISASFGALAILAPIVGIAMAKAGASIGLGFAAALGPIGLVIGALSALYAILTINTKTQTERQQDLVRSYGNTKKELDSLFGKIDQLSKINKRTADQERELANTKEALRKKAQELGIDYDNLALKVKNYADQLKFLDREAKKKEVEKANSGVNAEIETRERIFEEYNARLAEARRAADRARAAGNLDAVSREESKIAFLNPRADAALADIRRLRGKRVGLPEEDIRDPIGGGSTFTFTGTGKASAEYRFIEARDEIINNAAQLRSTLDRVGANSSEGREASLRFVIDEANIKGTLEQSLAEYLEEKYTAEQKQIDQQFNEQIKNIYRLANIKAISDKEAEEALDKIKEQKIRKEADLRAKSFSETLNSAAGLSSGIARLRNGDLSGAQSALTGIGGIGDQFKKGGLLSSIFGESNKLSGIFGGLGKTAPFVGAGIAVFQGISSIFQAGEAKREEEAQKQQARDETALRVLEAQEKHQRDLVEYQRSQAVLPFKDLQRELRIIDIQAQRDKITALQSGGSVDEVENNRRAKRASAISSTLRAESGKFESGTFFTEAARTPEELSKALGTVDKYAGSFALLQNIISEMAASRGRLFDTVGIYDSRIATVNSLPLPPEIKTAALDFIYSVIADNYRTEAMRGTGGKGMFTDVVREGKQLSSFQGALYDAGVGYRGGISTGVVNTSTKAVDDLIGEFTSDAAVIEQLLSLFEQSQAVEIEIAENTKRTAENTTKLTLLDDRRKSFLDLGNRRIFSQGLNIDFQNVKLPQSIASTILATAPGPVLASDTVSELKKLVTIAEEQAEWLAIIAANTDGRTNTSSSDIDNYLIRKLSEIRSRRIS